MMKERYLFCSGNFVGIIGGIAPQCIILLILIFSAFTSFGVVNDQGSLRFLKDFDDGTFPYT